MGGALHGVRILDLTRYQQGPSATVLLSDLGAEIIKVEPAGGEPGRAIGRDSEGFSAYFESQNRGKKSVVINLKAEGAREVILRFLPVVDVVVENFRPGIMEAMGLGYEDLKAHKPDIILASASAFGREGPWARRGGFDHIAQALSGLMVEQGGGPGNEPEALIGGFADQISANMLALAVTSALYARSTTGEGQHVDVSLIGSLTYLLSRPLTLFLRKGVQVGRERYRSATYTHHRCKDGRYIAIAANDQGMWTRFCGAIGRPEWREDERFKGPFDRERNKMELVEALTEVFQEHTAAEWEEALTAADVPNSAVQDFAHVAEHPQYKANDYLVEIEHPNLGHMRVPGPAIRMSGTPSRVQGGGPELGQHTEELLLELGYTWPEIEALKDGGVL